MSLIIKGLDMPKQGEILRIEVDYDGTVWWDDGRKYHELEDSAIQIPKGHGRLIDAKAIIKELSAWDWQDLYLPSHFEDLIDDVPTILEAEE